SEHFFALFLDNLRKDPAKHTSQHVVQALEETISQTKSLLREHEVSKPILLNVAVTNGDFVIATRYVSDAGMQPHTLYHSEGSRYVCRDGVCRMVEGGKKDTAVLIVSEKLTDVQEDWHEVPRNHFVVVREDLTVALRPIEA
ncbi:MAG: hypothetical protein D6743_08135, partial [Calditrichaeota bacterium]